MLGICYGMQTMAMQFGGSVESGHHREFGAASVNVITACALLDGLNDATGQPPRLNVWMSHGDRVTAVPEGFTVTASTDTVPIVAMADEARRYYGVQFHPEVTHTQSGEALLSPLRQGNLRLPRLWTAANIIEDQIARVHALVGDDEVLLGLSGGVDSSVVAALLHKAIGDAPYLRVRRHRPAALAGRRPGHGDVRRAHGRQSHPRQRRRALFRGAEGRR